MKTVNLHFAKTHLSRLVEDAMAGEDVIIAKAGKPLVRLVPISATETPRQLGALAGQVHEADDCWGPDAELEASFYEQPIEPPPVRRVAEPRPRKKS